MSRLLFAAARGARIQATLAGQWSTSPLYEALEQVRLDLKDVMKLLREQVISPRP